MTDTRTIHALGSFWSTGDRVQIGPYETGREAQVAAKAWISNNEDAKQVEIFNRVMPLFTVYAEPTVREMAERAAFT